MFDLDCLAQESFDDERGSEKIALTVDALTPVTDAIPYLLSPASVVPSPFAALVPAPRISSLPLLLVMFSRLNQFGKIDDLFERLSI